MADRCGEAPFGGQGGGRRRLVEAQRPPVRDRRRPGRVPPSLQRGGPFSSSSFIFFGSLHRGPSTGAQAHRKLWMRDPPGRISSGESPLQRRPLCRPGGLPHALGEAARARVEVEVEGSAAERRRRGRLDVEQLAAGAPIVVVGVDLGGLKSGAEMGLPPTGADPQERPLDVGQARPQQTNSAPLRAPGRGWTWPGRGPW